MSPQLLVGPADAVVAHATGADHLDYLDDVLSQRLRGVPVGTATQALELGPHGEPRGTLHLGVLADHAVLVVPRAARATLDRLAGRTFLLDATFTEPDHVAVRARGELARALPALDLPTAPGRAVVHGDVVLLTHPAGAELVGPADDVARLVAALVAAGARMADVAELDAIEVALGVPRLPEEVRRGVLPEELGLLPTHVHLAKGCYPGQEAVARMWMLGRPRRRLVVAGVADDVVPGELGTGRDRVEVTRVAEHEGRRVALALVPAAARAGDEPAPGVVVERVVGADLPVAGHDPAVVRRRDR